MSADYYLVPGSFPSSAKMHILTNGLANIGSSDGQLVTNAASSLSLSVNGNVNSGGNIGGSVGITTAPYYSLNPTGGSSGTTIIIPNGPTSQRPRLAYSLPGYLRYNTDSSYSTLEYYRNSQNVYLQLYSPPNVTSISPTTLTLNIGPTTINISGSNFDTSYPMSVVFYSKSFVASYIATNIQINSSASMTVTVPTGVYNGSSASSNSPYTIRVISNFTGMGYTFVNALTVVDGNFSFTAPSTLNTVYTSRSYSQSSFFLGTYGSTSNTYGPPPQIVATYAGNTVTNYKFNPASAGYIDVSNNGLTIDASGFITGTIKNGYVATSRTVSVGIIAGSNSSFDTSSNTTLNLIFAPLLLSFSGSGAGITPVTTYSYAYFQYTNPNTPTVPPNSQLAQYSPPNMPSPAPAATYTLNFSVSIPGTNIISADPSYSYLDFLIVGGGGGGGSGYQGGGGGAGGMVSSGLNSNYTYNYNIGGSGGRTDGLGMGPYQVPQGLVNSASISISVGGGGPGGYYNSTGGSGNPNNRSGSGGNSSITFPTSNVATITYNAYGGGAGAGEQNISTNASYMTGVNYQPLPGGSGGGASHGMQMAYTNYSVNSIQLTGSTYSGSPNYTLTVGGLSLSGSSGGSTTLAPFLAVYNSTSATPPSSSLLGFIAPYNTNGTTGTGGAGTYYLTGLTVPSGGTSYTSALASATAVSSSSTFTVPGGLSGSSTTGTSNNLIYTGIPTGTTYVGNYSLGFSNNSASGLGLTDTLTGYQGNNGGFGNTNNPYVGGGGGGASTGGGYANSAGNAGVGGTGLENFIKTVNYNTTNPSAGSGTVYAGGGGGSARSGTGGPWAGGTGGGGQGVNTWSLSNLAGNGTAGLGGGGGSAGGSGIQGTNGQYGGSGGSGTVIIRYRVA